MSFKSHKTLHKALLLTGAASAALISAVASAQTLSREEIVVTARKRAETLQDVPLSIQALSAQQIADADIADLSELANFAPGVALFENVDRGYGQVFIRGMQNTPPVGDTTRELASVFIDGIYFTGGVTGVMTDNVERVEVIKGPQSALLGRSTFSGAINFVSKTPGDEFSGEIRAKAATDDEYEIAASVEGPLLDDILSGRLSGRYREFGGQYTNSLNGQPLGEEEDATITGQLFFTPTETLTVKGTATYLTQEDGPPSATLTGKTPTHNFTSASGRTFFRGEVPLEGPIAQNSFPSDNADILTFDFGSFSFIPFDGTPGSERLDFRRNGFERDYYFASLDIAWEIAGGHVLSYLGGYSDDESVRLYDFELSEEDNYYGWRRTDADSSSHEVRLTSPDDQRFRWLVGLYYLEQERYVRDPGLIAGAGLFGAFGLPVGSVGVQPGPRTIVDRMIENRAVFGSIAYDFTDKLTLSAEGRYQVDELEDRVDRISNEMISGDTEAFLPRLIGEYQATDDVLLYAVVAKGLRPTTINSQFAGRTEAERDIIRATFPELEIDILAPEETIWSYEIGAKTVSFDDRLVFNINAYYSDWSDRQDLRSLLANIDGLPGEESTLVTVSGTDVIAYGVEIETSYAISDNWFAGLNAAWNYTELTDESSDATQARFFLDTTPNGERLPQAPEYSGTFITEYRAPVGGSDMDWYLRGEAIYVGSRFASTLNLAETGESIDINVRFGIDTERFSAGIFVENLFDDDTFESLRSNADCATSTSCLVSAYEAVLPRQRQAGIIVQARF